jgi:Fe-S-cluster-containing hydrogenase component 2
VAADGAVVAAARRGIAWARQRYGEATDGAINRREPWLMVSLSDGEDPHFRKAWFDPLRCPPSCSRPCERICPALAIPPAQGDASGAVGILEERCYGCGRCLPACPLGLIEERQQLLPRRRWPRSWPNSSPTRWSSTPVPVVPSPSPPGWPSSRHRPCPWPGWG